MQWSKKAIVLRIKPFFGKSIRFEEIKSAELVDGLLLLTKSVGGEIRFDLSEVIDSDKVKLLNIITKHSDL